jgi:hypothetical protein
VLEVLSLGGTLLAGGHEHAWITLPWYWLQTLPIASSVVPDRFSILADGAAAALFAFGLDAARARWAQAPRAVVRWAIALAALAAVAPLVPRPLPAGSDPPVPAGWTAAFAALRLPAGAHALVLPLPVSTFTEPLRWQADSGVPSSMFGGYFMGPTGSGQAATDGSGLSAEGLYLNRLWAQSPAGDAAAAAAGGPRPTTAPTVVQMRAQFAAWDPAAVVAVTDAHSALGRYLTTLLGPPTFSSGAMVSWRLPAGASATDVSAFPTCPRGPSAGVACGPCAAPCPAYPSP